MNYKKLWNKLKEEMILRKEKDDEEILSEFMRANDVLMLMVKAEVAESTIPERQLEIPLAGLLKGEQKWQQK